MPSFASRALLFCLMMLCALTLLYQCIVPAIWNPAPIAIALVGLLFCFVRLLRAGPVDDVRVSLGLATLWLVAAVIAIYQQDPVGWFIAMWLMLDNMAGLKCGLTRRRAVASGDHPASPMGSP